ncbi:MAG: hypothetical protein PHF84_11255 [bacterium]|nr:hypothetical protein [bacterium]
MKNLLFASFIFLICSGQALAFDYLPTKDLARGADTGYCSSAAALPNNPSFLAFLDDTLIGAGYISLYQPSYFYRFYLTYQNRINRDGAVGFMWSRISANSSVELFDYREDSFYAGYGHQIFPFFSLGGHLKVHNINTDVSSGSAYSSTISFLFSLQKRYFLSCVFKDFLSTGLKWTTGLEEEYLRKVIVGLGIRQDIGPLGMVFSADYQIQNIKIRDYYLSSPDSHPPFKTGLSLTYRFLSLSCGIIQEKIMKITGGMSINVISDIMLGAVYVHEASDLGYSTAVFIEYQL